MDSSIRLQVDGGRGTAEELVNDGLLTVAEAGKFLSVGRSTLYLAMDKGDLAYCKIGRARRIPRRAVVEFAAKQLLPPRA